jgi:hypothetical protein
MQGVRRCIDHTSIHNLCAAAAAAAAVAAAAAGGAAGAAQQQSFVSPYKQRICSEFQMYKANSTVYK